VNAEPIKKMLSSIIPFVRTVGLSIDEVGPGTATASLVCRTEVQNHLGTVHAGALYTVGESATGAVVLGLFMDLLPGVFIALKSAQVKHTKARNGDLLAKAQLLGDPTEVRKRYDETGKADFEVEVGFTVDGTEVAEITYTWAVRAPRS